MPGLAGEVANLVVALKLDDSGFSGKINRAVGQINAMDRGLSQMGRGVGQVGSGMSRLATVAGVAAAGGLFAVTKWAIDAETAFAGVQKTVDETATTSYPQLREELERIARIKPQEFAELAQIAEFGGQLGVVADDIGEFTDTLADFLVAVPQMGLQEAAFGLRRIQILTKAADDELDNIAATVVELGNNMETTEAEIIATAERFSAQAAAVGLSTSATLGLAAALTALGGEPQEAGTSVQRLFQNINLALAEGGERAELFAQVTGQSARQFRDAWTRDAEGTLLLFLESMGALSGDAVEQTRILDELGLADARLGKNVLNLANNMDVTRRAMGLANDEFVEGDAHLIEAEKRYATVAAQIGILRNNFKLAGVTIGSEVLPVLKDLSTEFVGFLQQPGTQQALKDFAVGVGSTVRDLADAAREIDWGPIIGGLQAAGAVMKAAFDAFRQLPGPLQSALIGAIALNKASGGALTLIVRGLGNIGLGALRTVGVMRVNAGVVNVAGAVGGGVPGGRGVPVPGGRGGLSPVAAAGAVGIATTIGGLIGIEIVNVLKREGERRVAEGTLTPTVGNRRGILGPTKLDEPVSVVDPRVERAMQDVRDLMMGRGRLTVDAINRAQAAVRAATERGHAITGRGLQQLSDIGRQTAAGVAQIPPGLSRIAMGQNVMRSDFASRLQASVQAQRESRLAIAQLARKPTNVKVDANVGVTVNTFVSGTMLQRQQTYTRVASGYRGGAVEGAI